MFGVYFAQDNSVQHSLPQLDLIIIGCHLLAYVFFFAVRRLNALRDCNRGFWVWLAFLYLSVIHHFVHYTTSIILHHHTSLSAPWKVGQTTH